MRNLGIVLILLLAVISPASGQASETILSGNIVDDFGAVVDSVHIYAKDKDGKVFADSSNADGTYTLSLMPGVYELSFVKAPFETFKIFGYQIAKLPKMHLDVSLICRTCGDTIDLPFECDDCPVVEADPPALSKDQILVKSPERKSKDDQY